MRQHFYDFAHKILPHDVHEEPTFWKIISSDKAASYLMMRWSAAGGPKGGPLWMEPLEVAGAEVRIIRLPPAEDVSEAHYTAIVKLGERLRYFVAEQGAGRVNLAEWTSTTQRIKYGPLEENSNALPELDGVPSRAQPWEVSRDAVRGLPYLVSFLDGIRQELTAQPSQPRSIADQPRSKMNAIMLAIGLIGFVIAVVLLRG
jgi:hypothetical protein